VWLNEYIQLLILVGSKNDYFNDIIRDLAVIYIYRKREREKYVVFLVRSDIYETLKV